MNKDIESRLKDLRLTAPSPEFKATVLSNARAAWCEKNEATVPHMQFRNVLALAASLLLFIGGIAFLNQIEERDTCQTLNSCLEKSRDTSEDIAFLKEIGLNPEYCLAISKIKDSPQLKLESVFNRFEKELEL